MRTSTTIPASEQRVKQLVRWLSKQGINNPEAGIYNVATVDAELTALLASGFRLMNTHFVGGNDQASPAYGIMYILVKD